MTQTAINISDAAPAWAQAEVEAIFNLPFNDLLFRAQQVHRANFDPNKVQMSTLINIKTGGCAENCGYCSQSAHYDTPLDREALIEVEKVLGEARKAKEAGATRFCMGAAWRKPKANDLQVVLEMIKGVKALEMESCVTLGMLEDEHVALLKEAGLDYYNHNIDTSPEYYDKVVTTRTFGDRIATINRVQDAGIRVCSGGILGMGESRRDRGSMLLALANLTPQPQSVPINLLIKIHGTPLADSPELDIFEFIRTIAVARILLPASYVRLSAGREQMSDEAQALCFLAGANSMFMGEKLLTAGNQSVDHDRELFRRLDIRAEV
jgi:biotin synthase